MNANENLPGAWLGEVKILNLDPVSADLDQSSSHFQHLLCSFYLGGQPTTYAPAGRFGQSTTSHLALRRIRPRGRVFLGVVS